MNFFKHVSYATISAVLVGGMLFVSACSHRAVHGVSQGGKVRTSSGPQSDGSMDTSRLGSEPQVGDHRSSTDSLGSSDGLTGNRGFLDQDSLFADEGLIQDISPKDSAGDYWEQRKRAELVTSQAGLRDIFFGFDSWELTDEAKAVLARNAEWLKAHPNARITIEGHCDERGTRAYNYVLGEKRAYRTRNYLVSLGVDAERLMIMSYGKDNPVCRQNSEACFGKNRRAHVVLGINVASVPGAKTEGEGTYE